MHMQYSAPWLPLLEDRCALLEALAEGWVTAYEIEMADAEGARKEEFPCCVKCGGLCFCPVPGMAGHREDTPISETQRKALERARGSSDVNAAGGPRNLRVQSAKELCRSKKAHALELAIFQCATERFRDKNCYVAIDYTDDGNVHAYVRYPETEEMKNPQEMAVSSDLCSCGGEGH